MADNYGKAFERKFAEDWLKIPDSDITRLYDITNGFKSLSNVSDFIAYMYPNMFYIECKVVQSGNTLALSRITQYDKLLKKSGIPGIRSGVVTWFVDRQKVIYTPISTVKKLQDDGKKSVNIKMLESDEYSMLEIPSKLKRTFMDSDYSVMHNLPENW